MKKFLSLCLALALCLSLAVSASAEGEQKITVGEESYESLLGAILSQEEDQPVTVKLESDVQLTAAIVLGESDYGGLFNGEKVTVASHDVTIDLNGFTLSAAKGAAALEVQEGYTLTIADTSEAKTGKIAAEVEEPVEVAEGATYNALPAAAPAKEDDGTSAAGTPAEAGEGEKEFPFTDVPDAFKESVAWAVEQKITNGTTATTFGSANPCTQNHILTFIWRANGSPEAEGEGDFAKAVAWAIAGKLAPEDVDGAAACTRSEAVTYLWKQAGSPETEAKVSFSDVAEDAEYAAAVAWAVENKVTNGTGGSLFSPDAPCNRGQIVTFLYRAASIQPAGEPAAK